MSTFVLISDPHVTVPNPQTGWMAARVPNEPTLYGESVELLQAAIGEINAMPEVDFVLCAGDLTKDSEPYNHDAARELFTQFRKPLYCIAGNHDQPRPPKLRPTELLDPHVVPIRTDQIPALYGDFGFKNTALAAFSCDPTPDIHIIGLCSSKPDEDRGWISPQMLGWLDEDLSKQRGRQRETILMLHHSIIEHVPHETIDPTFSWFHVENAEALKSVLRKHDVRVTLTGHLHMQDVKVEDGLYNIATASLAGFPHAYRIFTLKDGVLQVRSRRLTSIPSHPDLQRFSLDYTSGVFVDILADLLMSPPFAKPPGEARATAEKLRAWWPSIAAGDEAFNYSAEDLGDAALAAYINSFNDTPPTDNDLDILL